MKRLQYSVEELKKLLGYVGEYYNKPASHDNILPGYYTGRRLYALIDSLPTDPLTPYTQKQIYGVIKCNSIEQVVQIMYHTPLIKLPLLINMRITSKNPSVVLSIIKWRLSISK